jgi:hypothetical protein
MPVFLIPIAMATGALLFTAYMRHYDPHANP